MGRDKGLAGVIVLYNPKQEEVIANISSYLDELELLVAVDNSEKPRVPDALVEFFRQHPKIVYLANGGNLGIGQALNTGARIALQAGFEWLLTMDQDSKACTGMIQNLLATTQKVKKDTIGLVAPRYILDEPAKANQEDIEESLTAITSGSLINLKVYDKIGPFREDLFIDFVDHEYCLRLNVNGYKVWVNNQVELYHQIGNASNHYFFGRRLITSNHNYIRRYYITRNRLAILNQFRKQFPEYCKFERNSNLIEIAKIVLLEKDKYRKLKSVVKGYRDFKRNKFGKKDFADF
jgi:rhamnosyltransferase